MYDRHVTQATIDAVSAAQHWDLIPHSHADVDTAIAHFAGLWDPDQRRLRRPLTPPEQRFQQNERKLCALDYRYWTDRYAWIINWSKQPARFVPNVAQSIIRDLWAESEARGEAIWMQQLKARRLGVSTESELAVQHRYQFHPYSNCVIASADPDKTIEMAGILGFCLSKQPWWLLPQGKPKIYRGLPIEFPDIHTNLTIQAGNQFNGVARGSSPNVIHLSELCEWLDAEDLIDGALLPAIIDTPDVFGILESTAKGGGYWQRTWNQNKRDYQRGTGRIRPVFLPWYVGTDIYPTPADQRKRPIPAGWIPADRTIAHAERARAYVLTNPLLFQYLAHGNRDWQMPRSQMWWWEIGYATAKEKKTLNIFLAEYCSDDFEAFQSSNIPVIDPEILLGYQERTRNPIGVYTVIGPDIPQSLVIPRRYWRTDLKPISIATREIMPRFDVRYQLQPLQFDGYPSFDEGLKVLIYEWPEPSESYGVGVDTSEGVGQDNALIEILREATPSRYPGQVCEFASNYITAFQLWPITIALSCLYSTYRPSAAKRVQCRVAIECFANGKHVQHEMQKRGWSNFHPWKAVDNRKPTQDRNVNKIGVYTNQSFRSGMLDMLLTMLSEEAIDLPSPYLVQELTTLERMEGNKKVAAAADAHDDRVMALGFPLFSLHVGKSPSKQFTRKRVDYVPSPDDQIKINYPIWQPPEQGRDHPLAPILKVFRSTGRLQQVALARMINRGMPRGFQ